MIGVLCITVITTQSMRYYVWQGHVRLKGT